MIVVVVVLELAVVAVAFELMESSEYSMSLTKITIRNVAGSIPLSHSLGLISIHSYC